MMRGSTRLSGRCALFEQQYHSGHALGDGVLEDDAGRPEADRGSGMAMSVLGNGLSEADNDEDALTVQEAFPAGVSRLGWKAAATTTERKACGGRSEQALQLKGDVYSGRVDPRERRT